MSIDTATACLAVAVGLLDAVILAMLGGQQFRAEAVRVYYAVVCYEVAVVLGSLYLLAVAAPTERVPVGCVSMAHLVILALTIRTMAADDTTPTSEDVHEKSKR